jgi:RNA polymerase subunit RPABC4/transcription elongation factor Spt4
MSCGRADLEFESSSRIGRSNFLKTRKNCAFRFTIPENARGLRTFAGGIGVLPVLSPGSHDARAGRLCHHLWLRLAALRNSWLNFSVMKRGQPFDCPNCGAEVPSGAKACPECGSDEKTGWNEEEAVYDGTGIEDPKEFNYDEWKKEEGLAPQSASNKQIVIIIVTLLLLAAFVFFLLRR